MSWARRWLMGAAGMLLLVQLLPAGRPAPSPLVGASLEASPAVQAILERSCFDCHSDQTVWPGYAWVAPLSWWTASEVRRGRAALDFSSWQGYGPEKQVLLMQNGVARARARLMPPTLYSRMHPETRLSAADIELLARYADNLAPGHEVQQGTVLVFCREDGQLGEQFERRLRVSWDGWSYHLADLEAGRELRATTLDEALDGCARLLAADPAMRLETWRRRYRGQWERALRAIATPAAGPRSL